MRIYQNKTTTKKKCYVNLLVVFNKLFLFLYAKTKWDIYTFFSIEFEFDFEPKPYRNQKQTNKQTKQTASPKKILFGCLVVSFEFQI